MHLRPAQPESDYPRIVALINTVFAEPVTLAQFQGWLDRVAPGRIYRLMVAADARDEVVGYSEVVRQEWSPANHYAVWMVVDPQWRGQGIGAALHAEAQTFLAGLGATHLTSEVRDDSPAALRFAQGRGFAMDRHQFESTLDLTTFDETPFLSSVAPLADAGIRLFTMADCGDTREARARLYEVNHTTALQIPGSDGTWMPTFADFERDVCGAAWYRPEGQWVAADGDTWIGLAAVRLYPETQGAYNLMTGVLAPYRGRKIALALKLAAIRYAREHGARYLRTDNDSLNAPMLAINRKLGYQPRSGKYILRCRLDVSC